MKIIAWIVLAPVIFVVAAYLLVSICTWIYEVVITFKYWRKPVGWILFWAAYFSAVIWAIEYLKE